MKILTLLIPLLILFGCAHPSITSMKCKFDETEKEKYIQIDKKLKRTNIYSKVPTGNNLKAHEDNLMWLHRRKDRCDETKAFYAKYMKLSEAWAKKIDKKNAESSERKAFSKRNNGAIKLEWWYNTRNWQLNQVTKEYAVFFNPKVKNVIGIKSSKLEFSKFHYQTKRTTRRQPKRFDSLFFIADCVIPTGKKSYTNIQGFKVEMETFIEKKSCR